MGARMSYKDVREWIQRVEEMGELKVVEGADWNLEIGALSVLASKHKENSPALLFDRIKDFAIQTVGKGRVWQMIAEARFVNRASVLDWTGKRTVGKPLTVCPEVFSC